MLNVFPQFLMVVTHETARIKINYATRARRWKMHKSIIFMKNDYPYRILPRSTLTPHAPVVAHLLHAAKR